MGTWVAALALAWAGCATAVGEGAVRRLSAATARVQVFTEPDAVDTVLVVDERVVTLAGTTLRTWDAISGHAIPTALDGEPVQAITARDGSLWALTDTALLRLDVRAPELVERVPLAPALVATPAPRLAIDAGGGAWIATGAALYRGDLAAPLVVELGADITALAPDVPAGVVVGTTAGVWRVSGAGEATAIDDTAGSTLVVVRAIVRTTRTVVAVGDDAAGRQRIALIDEAGVRTVRLLPDVRWDAIAAAGDDVLVRAGEQLLRFGTQRRTALGRVTRGSARVVALDGEPLPALALEALAGGLPAHASALGAAADGSAWVGTAALGVARVASVGPPQMWLRPHALVAGARDLTVACGRRDDCWLATGAATWRWTDGRFVDVPGGGDVIAVMAAPADGGVTALRRTSVGTALELVTGDPLDGTWRATGPAIGAAGTAPTLRFARLDHTGAWWLGWGADRAGPTAARRIDRRGVGHALRSARAGWPTMRDVGFDDQGALWLARTDGVTRLAPDGVASWPLVQPGEQVLGLAVTSRDAALVATTGGLVRWNGAAWDRPPGLQAAVREVASARTGAVWLATDRGVAWVDGDRLRRFDRRRGLPDDRVLDVAVDGYGRVWARTAGALVLIDPSPVRGRSADAAQKQHESR